MAGSADELLAEISWAIADYGVSYPVPYSLAPNLHLASMAAAEIVARRAELDAALAAVGLPEGSDLATLIHHHRTQAGVIVAFEIIAADGKGVEPLTDEEWREFQAIPEQGYSHRYWVDRKIALRAAAVSAEKAQADE